MLLMAVAFCHQDLVDSEFNFTVFKLSGVVVTLRLFIEVTNNSYLLHQSCFL